MLKLIFKLRIYWMIKGYHRWASNQFPNSTAQSSLDGLKREIIEVEEELFKFGKLDWFSISQDEKIKIDNDIAKEYVDCIMYILDSSRRAGISQEKLFTSFKEKLEINKRRNWKINEDKSYSHIK